MKCHFKVIVMAHLAGGEEDKLPVTLHRYVVLDVANGSLVPSLVEAAADAAVTELRPSKPRRDGA